MDFGEVLTRAWKIIWKFKVLWLFGILSGCINSSGPNNGGNGAQYQLFEYDFGRGAVPGFLGGFERWLNENVATFIGLIVLVVLIFSVIALVLGTFGRTGVVRGVWLADDGAQTLTFRQLWNDAKSFFWRVLGVLLLVLLVSLLLILLITIPFILSIIGVASAGEQYGMLALPTTLLFCCGLCILIPLFWIISLVVDQAIVAIVGENLGIADGLRRAWGVIRSNLGTYILMALLLFVGGLIIGFVITLPLAILVLPVAAGFMSQSQAGETIGIGLAIFFGLLFLPILLIINGIIQSYITSVWTLTFRRLTGRGPSELRPSAEVTSP